MQFLTIVTPPDAPLLTTGTSTAYAITPTIPATSYAPGQRWAVKFDEVCGAAPTLQVSGLATPPNLVKLVGGVLTNIAAEELQANLVSDVLMVSATQALVISVLGKVVVSGLVQSGQNAKFHAYSTGVQAISSSTNTKVHINTEEFDIGGQFDATTNYRFTPTTGGYYQINWSAFLQANAGTLTNAYSLLYKNGAAYKTGALYMGAGIQIFNSTGSALVYLNGTTDYVELWAFILGTSPIIYPTAPDTYFSGAMIP